MNIREWTLPVYTILIQLATGALLSLWVVRLFNRDKIAQDILDRISRYPISVILVTILSGMIGSHFHLSLPLISIFSVLNFRTSWISREITFTISYFLSVCLLFALIWFSKEKAWLKTILGWIAIGLGLTTIYCMSRIYMISIHPAWNTPVTIISFYNSALLLGVMSLALMLFLELKFAEVRGFIDLNIRYQIFRRSIIWFTAIAVLLGGVVMASNHYLLSHLRSGDEAALTSLQLLLGLYRPLLSIRILATIMGLFILLLMIYWVFRKHRALNTLFVPLYLSCSFIMLGEILGRILFYAMDVRIGS